MEVARKPFAPLRETASDKILNLTHHSSRPRPYFSTFLCQPLGNPNFALLYSNQLVR
jgi:hypothetical protein